MVEGNEAEDEPGKLVNDREQAIAHPVHEPLLVIFLAFGLNHHVAHESRVHDTKDAGQQRLTQKYQAQQTEHCHYSDLKYLAHWEARLLLDVY